jgi:hypothetical protein
VLHVQMAWCLCRAFRQDFASSWSSEWVSECLVDNLTKIQPLHITNQSIATSSTKPATYNAFLPQLNFFLSCQSAPLPPVSSMKHFGHELIHKVHENNSGTAYYVVLSLIWYNGFWNARSMWPHCHCWNPLCYLW